MEMIGGICLLIGGLISLFYSISLLVLAFKKSVLWGLACLFIPFVTLIFVVIHWGEAKGPFLKGFLAIPFLIVGFFLMPAVSGAIFA